MSVPTSRRWAVLVIVSPLLLACQLSRSEDEEGARQMARVDAKGRVVLRETERHALDLRVAPARRGTLSAVRIRVGVVRARPADLDELVAPVSAREIGPPAVLGGAAVKRGDVLLTLRPLVSIEARANARVTRARQRGEVRAARARIAALKTQLQRVLALVASKLATPADLARARADLASAEARLGGLRESSRLLGAIIGERPIAIRAPGAGVVTWIRARSGGFVRRGDVVARVLRAGARWIELAVPPDEDVGSRYRVEITGTWRSARLLRRGRVVASDGARRDRLEVDAGSAAPLLPGQAVAVRVLTDLRGVVVPLPSVVSTPGHELVFVQVGTGTYEPREVSIRLRVGGKALVERGLQAGDRVVTRGTMALLQELRLGRLASRPSSGSGSGS